MPQCMGAWASGHRSSPKLGDSELRHQRAQAVREFGKAIPLQQEVWRHAACNMCVCLASLVQSPSQICLWPCINPAWRHTRHTHTHAVMPGAGCDSRGASLPRLTLRVLEEVDAGRTVSSVSAVPQVMEAVGWCVFQSVWIHRTCGTRTPVISNRPSPYMLTEVFQCWRFKGADK